MREEFSKEFWEGQVASESGYLTDEENPYEYDGTEQQREDWEMGFYSRM